MSEHIIAIIIIIIVVIIITISFWFILRYIKKTIHDAIFLPSYKISWLPSEEGYAYTDLYLPVNNNNIVYHSNAKQDYDDRYGPLLNVWYFDQFNKNRLRGQHSTTIVFYHGNSGNISQRKYVVDICHRFHINLILMDYRGYGLSGGCSSACGIYEDGTRVYEYAKSLVPEEDIIVWGESLGGTVACHVANVYNPRSLILMSTFSSLRDVIMHQKTIKGFTPPDWTKSIIITLCECFCHPMSSIDIIPHITVPIIIIHSPEDSFVPYDCAQKMFSAIRHENKLFLTTGGDHACPEINDEILGSMFAFIGIQSNCRNDDISYISSKLKTVTQDFHELLGEE